MKKDKIPLTTADYKRAAENGIKATTLASRILYYGWDKDEAINTPPNARSRNKDIPLTREDYERAAAHGINSSTLANRVRIRGWDKEKAITTSPHNRGGQKRKWCMIAESRGISQTTFYSRVRQGWSFEESAIIPLVKPGERMPWKYVKRMKELAESNGIPYKTFISRVEAGWDVERAATVTTKSLLLNGGQR
ncbi:hypothetical protein D3C72_728330 [compost metagenome]